jgi:Flp pilus assembly protein TadG
VVRVREQGVQRGRGERGTVTVLMAGIVVLVGMTMWWLGVAGSLMVQRSRAQTAADAAALAGAVDGEDAARRFAEANGALLVGYRSSDVADGVIEVDVDVVVGDARASAGARYEAPPPPPPPPPSSVPGTTVPGTTVPSGPAVVATGPGRGG